MNTIYNIINCLYVSFSPPIKTDCFAIFSVRVSYSIMFFPSTFYDFCSVNFLSYETLTDDLGAFFFKFIYFEYLTFLFS